MSSEPTETICENQPLDLFAKAGGNDKSDTPLTGRYKVEFVQIQQRHRTFGEDVQRPAIVFVFKEEELGAKLTRTFNASLFHTSGCVKFAYKLAADTPPTPADFRDGESFTRFLHSLIGRKYLARVEASKNGKHSQIVDIFSLE